MNSELIKKSWFTMAHFKDSFMCSAAILNNYSHMLSGKPNKKQLEQCSSKQVRSSIYQKVKLTRNGVMHTHEVN